MLLRFSVQNWMSFRDEATLSMIATRERQHSEHASWIERYDTKVLPIAVIYGGNASGKSNLVKALRFAQKLIVSPPKVDSGISVKPFRLSNNFSKLPTNFRFDLLIGERLYEYKFSVTSKEVIREQLSLIKRAGEELLFVRENGKLKLSEMIVEKERQSFAFRGTHDNQLYLTNSVSQKLIDFKPVFDWFEQNLVLIDPDTHYAGLPDITSNRHPNLSLKKVTTRLRDLDSGIYALRQEDISPESIFSKELLEDMTTDLKDDQAVLTPWEEEGSFVRKEKGKLVARRLSSIHRAKSGENIAFPLADESDGTRRLLNLLPAFLLLENRKGPFVFVIDELDRSLHSLLTRELLERYLLQRKDSSRSQLIFTTHDLQLMDQAIFRRDEMWVTDRDEWGASDLIAFSDYKDVRRDKDIRKSYLQGRMGGVPRIRSVSVVCDDEDNE
jgi:AAA15 family ATPase/GTPase